MNLVIIGAQASGKMTIGQEIEFVRRFMEYGSISTELIRKIRMNFFEAFAQSNKPLIFTVVIDFNDSNDIEKM